MKSRFSLFFFVSLVLLFPISVIACQSASIYSNNTENITQVTSIDSQPDTNDIAPVDDNNPPTFEAIQASDITDYSAAISWRTNKKTIGQVEYGETSEYGTTEPMDDYTSDCCRTRPECSCLISWWRAATRREDT